MRTKGHAPIEWYTREQACVALGCSHFAFRKLHIDGHVVSHYTKDGRVRYDPEQIDELARNYVPRFGVAKGARIKPGPTPKTDGAREARITEMLQNGARSFEIVLALRVTYQEVADVAHYMRTNPLDIETSETKRVRLEYESKLREQEKIVLRTINQAVKRPLGGRHPRNKT